MLSSSRHYASSASFLPDTVFLFICVVRNFIETCKLKILSCPHALGYQCTSTAKKYRIGKRLLFSCLTFSFVMFSCVPFLKVCLLERGVIDKKERKLRGIRAVSPFFFIALTSLSRGEYGTQWA